MLKNFSIKNKILFSTLFVIIVLTLSIFLILYLVSNKESKNLSNQMTDYSKNNMSTLVKSIYNACEVTDQSINKILDEKIKIYKDKIKQIGGLNFSNEIVNWNAINQFNKEITTISLPKVMLGNDWFGQKFTFDEKMKFVDDVREQYFYFTIFQRMNNIGDMLRIATNVETADGKRAIGTYIPFTNPDGSQNPVVSAVMKGLTYRGSAYVVKDYYQTIYEPIKDKNNNVIGMLFVGVSLKVADKLRENILKTVVGKSGYVYVLGGSGARKGYYIISKDGKRDGENIWDVTDANNEKIIQKIITQATEQPEGSISFIQYSWINPGEEKPNEKIVGLAYFKPFDWVICAGTNLSEIEELADNVKEAFNSIYFYIFIVITVMIILTVLFVNYISNKIANPIKNATEIMLDISKGRINEAISKLENIT